VPWEHTIFYEMHPRGYTKRHPAVPPSARHFAGLAAEVIDYIRSLA
jgi:isoamylase